MLLRVFILGSAILWMEGCKNKEAAEHVTLKQVTLPGGEQIMAEVMMRQSDMMSGMMFRNSLAPDRGLLFIHNRPGRYTYWMRNVKVPLDIIWMDKAKKIVEISANTPPCLDPDPVKCPQYGGKVDSRFVLELAAGRAAAYGLAIGQTLSF